MLYCYQCGCELTSSDHCPNCGADVRQYKEIMVTSNLLYNEGLDKARVRDLSGAIASLKQSLWYNKYNLDARNVLGLCYFEVGETVSALAEWVISKNLNDQGLHVKNNPAEKYLTEFQNDKQTRTQVSEAVTRYNNALDSCNAGNVDVAALQLKKVLALNPHFLRARQLLALVYIERKDWKKAERELVKCVRLDVSNTTSLRYLDEVQGHLSHQQGDERKKNGDAKAAGTVKNGVRTYREGNETIIEPVGSKKPGIDGFGVPTGLIGGLIGLVIGAALVAFLVMPQRVQTVQNEAANQVRSYSEESSSKDASVSDLQNQVTTLQSQVDSLNSQLSEAQNEEASAEKSSGANALFAAANAVIATPDNTEDDIEAMAQVDPATVTDGQSDAFVTLFNTLYTQLQDPVLEKYAWDGINLYEADGDKDYKTIISDLEIANRFEIKDSYSMTYVERLYYLGDSYYQAYLAASESERADMSDYLDKAVTVLTRITDNYKDSDYAQQANARLQDVESLKASENVGTAESSSGSSSSESSSADSASSAGSSNASSDASSAASSSSSAAPASDQSAEQSNAQ